MSNLPANLESMDVSQATHYLQCTHWQGSSVHYFKMKCVLLKEMAAEKSKVLVFGERHWRDREHLKRVRYVDSSRLVTIPKT